MATKKALLCDDDKTSTLIVKHLLTQAGFSVRTAINGAEGLALLQAEKADLLVLDLDMPVKNGIAVLQELQKADYRPTCIIVLSAHENPDDHETVLALGAQGIMVKPFKPADLVKTIEDMMKEGKV